MGRPVRPSGHSPRSDRRVRRSAHAAAAPGRSAAGRAASGDTGNGSCGERACDGRRSVGDAGGHAERTFRHSGVDLHGAGDRLRCCRRRSGRLCRRLCRGGSGACGAAGKDSGASTPVIPDEPRSEAHAGRRGGRSPSPSRRADAFRRRCGVDHGARAGRVRRGLRAAGGRRWYSARARPFGAPIRPTARARDHARRRCPTPARAGRRRSQDRSSAPLAGGRPAPGKVASPESDRSCGRRTERPRPRARRSRSANGAASSRRARGGEPGAGR